MERVAVNKIGEGNDVRTSKDGRSVTETTTRFAEAKNAFCATLKDDRII